MPPLLCVVFLSRSSMLLSVPVALNLACVSFQGAGTFFALSLKSFRANNSGKPPVWSEFEFRTR